MAGFNIFSEENMAKLRKSPILTEYVCTLIQDEGFRKLASNITEKGLFVLDEFIPNFGFKGTDAAQRRVLKKLVQSLELPHYEVSKDELNGKKIHDGKVILNPFRTQVRHGSRCLLLEPAHLTSTFLMSRKKKSAKIGIGLTILYSFVMDNISEKEKAQLLELNTHLEERISQVNITFIKNVFHNIFSTCMSLPMRTLGSFRNGKALFWNYFLGRGKEPRYAVTAPQRKRWTPQDHGQRKFIIPHESERKAIR